MTLTEENDLIEKIANLLDEYLETEIEDLSNIDKMVQLEKKEARLQQQMQNNLDEINSYDAIYISHIHPDHFSTKTLKHINKKIPVYISSYHSKFLKFNIEKLGFKAIELSNGKRHKLKNNFWFKQLIILKRSLILLHYLSRTFFFKGFLVFFPNVFIRFQLTNYYFY